jgi:hypothetical protein
MLIKSKRTEVEPILTLWWMWGTLIPTLLFLYFNMFRVMVLPTVWHSLYVVNFGVAMAVNVMQVRRYYLMRSYSGQTEHDQPRFLWWMFSILLSILFLLYLYPIRIDLHDVRKDLLAYSVGSLLIFVACVYVYRRYRQRARALLLVILLCLGLASWHVWSLGGIRAYPYTVQVFMNPYTTVGPVYSRTNVIYPLRRPFSYFDLQSGFQRGCNVLGVRHVNHGLASAAKDYRLSETGSTEIVPVGITIVTNRELAGWPPCGG